MEDDRLRKLETEVSIIARTQDTMGTTLERIAKSLERLNEFYTETKLLESKYQNMDRELRDSFKRVHDRMDKNDERHDRTDGIISKITWLILTPVILAVIGSYVKGGI